MKCARLLFLFFLVGCTTTIKPVNQEAAGINVQLGVAYLQQGNTARAKVKLVQALKQAPNWPPALDAMGLFLAKIGNMNEAEKYHLRALSIAPKDSDVQNNYGTFLCRAGRLKQAEQHFLLAARNPDYLHSAEAYENAGLCALKIPDKKKAKTYFEEALVHEPNRESTRIELERLNEH